MKTLRGYTLSYLEKKPDFGSVWVINSSKGERRGDVCLTVARNKGLGSDTLVVPATFIPVDLTTVVSRPQLLSDNQFRQALSSGLLRLVHPDDAAALFEGEDADESCINERTRLSNYMLVGGVAHQQAAVQTDVEVHTDFKPSFEDNHIPPAVQNVIQRVKTSYKENELSEAVQKDFAAKLRNLGDQEESVLKHVYNSLIGFAPIVANEAKAISREAKAA